MGDTPQFESLIIGVLEDQAFLFSDPIERDDLPETLIGGLRVELQFQGALGSGSFVLGCPRAFAAELAANFLGLDNPDQVQPDDAEDALKELLNVVAGRALAALSVSELPIDLSPSTLTLDADGSNWSALRNSTGGCALLVEDHPTIFRLAIAGAA